VDRYALTIYPYSFAPPPSDVDLHQIPAEDQLPGKTAAGLLLARHWHDPRHEVVEDKSLHSAALGHRADLLDRRVGVEHVLPQGIRWSPLRRVCAELEIDPFSVDHLVHQDVRSPRQGLQVAVGVGARIAREDHRPVRGVEAEGERRIDLMVVHQRGPDLDAVLVVGVDQKRGGHRAGGTILGGKRGSDLRHLHQAPEVGIGIIQRHVVDGLGERLPDQVGHLSGAGSRRDQGWGGAVGVD